MSEYKFLDVTVTAQEGLKSLEESLVRAFCIPRDFISSTLSHIRFAYTTEFEGVTPILGVYRVSTGDRVGVGNASFSCQAPEGADYKFLTYTLDKVLDTTSDDAPGFIFAFYNGFPPSRYTDRYSSQSVDVALIHGGAIQEVLDTAWCRIATTGLTTQFPYMEFSSLPSSECGTDSIPMMVLGTLIVPVLGKEAFHGVFTHADAGALGSEPTWDGLTPQAHGSAVPLSRSMLPGESWDNLINRKFKNLYASNGWIELLSFRLPSNWVWDSTCSIIPDNNTYTLCGRVYNGQLEWQFGNLITDDVTSGDEDEDEERIEWNPSTGRWEVVGGDTPDIGDPSIDPSVGTLEMVASNRSSFSQPILKWAGKEISERNMLSNGKLRASCEPVYLGMFNIASSYLAGIEYTVTADTECDDCSPTDVPESYYEACPEVSPVWFLFASTKDDMINLVAMEHKLNAGDSYSNNVLTSAVTDPYQLYGVPPKIINKRIMGVPPGSYSYFKQWMYTSFILPPDEYIVHITNDTPELLESVGGDVGYYYDTGNGYLRIDDSLIESGCRSTPCPRWMQEHSIIDNDNLMSVDIPLCSFVADKEPAIYDGSSKGYRGFIDNVNDYEYLWQRINGKLAYLPYSGSSYVNDITKVDGIQTHTTAYLPIGSRYSKSYASYTNFALKLSSAGRCLKFERAFTTIEGSEDSIIDDNYVIAAPGSVIYTSTVFDRIKTAPSEVNDIALTSGTLLAYDTPPLMNIDKVVMFEDDIGDGVVAITRSSTLTYEPSDPVLLYTNTSYKQGGADAVLHDAVVAPGFVICTGSVNSNDGILTYSFTSGAEEKTTYNGTLVLQGATQLGGSVSYSDRITKTLNVTSFSNVVADQALLIPHDRNAKFNKVTVPYGSTCSVGYPETVYTLMAAGAGDLTEVKYATAPIYATTEDSVQDTSKVLGSTVDAEVVRGLYYYLLQNGYNDTNWPAIVLGQGNGDMPEGAAIVSASGDAVSDNKYYLNRKLEFQLTNRPRYSNQYAAVFYPSAGATSSATKARLYFESDAEYPISYSIWGYNVDQSMESQSCILRDAELAAGSNVVDADIDLTANGSRTGAGYVVIFITRGSVDAGGKIATVKNLTWIKSTDVSETDTINQDIHGAQHSIDIDTLEIDADGSFVFKCKDSSSVDTLHIGKLIGSGIFDHAAETSSVTIDDIAEFEGIYVPHKNDKLPVLGVNSSLAAVHNYSSSSAISTDYYLNSLYVCSGIQFKPGITVYINNAVLGHGSYAGYLVVREVPEYEQEEVDVIDVNVVTLGTTRTDSYIPGSKVSARGTMFSDSKTIIGNTSDKPMLMLPDITAGIDAFDIVPAGTNITGVTGSVVSDGSKYRYLFKSTSSSGSSLVDIAQEAYAEFPEDHIFVSKRTVGSSVFTDYIVFKVPEGYSPELYYTDTSYEDFMTSLCEVNDSCSVNGDTTDLLTLEDLLDDSVRSEHSYIDRVNDPTNSCYTVSSTTISCCTSKPVDCCETDPDNCDKSCGAPSPVDPYRPGPGTPGDEDDDDTMDPPFPPPGGGGGGGGGSTGGGGSGGGTSQQKKGYMRLNDVYVYSSGDRTLLKEVFTNDIAKINAVRGGTASTDRKTFTLSLKSCTFSFANVYAQRSSNANTSGSSVPSKLVANVTGEVNLALSASSLPYIYPYGNVCTAGSMRYGLGNGNYVSDSSSTIDVHFKSTAQGGDRVGKDTQSIDMSKTAYLDVNVTIADTFKLTPNTPANSNLTNRLYAMGLKWEEIDSKNRRIYDSGAYVTAKIRYIQIARRNNFMSRLMYTAGQQLANEGKYAGRATPTGTIDIESKSRTTGSKGQPSAPLTITASRGSDGNFSISFDNNTPGANPVSRKLNLTLDPVIVGYNFFIPRDSSITAALQNSEWQYCENGENKGYCDGIAKGRIDVSFDIVRK